MVKRRSNAIEPEDGAGEPVLQLVLTRFRRDGSTAYVRLTITRPRHATLKTYIGQVVLNAEIKSARWRSNSRPW